MKPALVMLLQAGYLFAWTTPERVDRRPEGYVVYVHDIAVGRDGTPSAVWSECKAGTYYEKIMYARREGDTWTVPINISRDSGDLRTPAIALDDAGNAIVVWSQEGTASIRYVRQVDDTWSLRKLCFADNGITPRLATDSRGRVHLLFEDLASQGGIWYSYYVAEADSWVSPTRVALGTSWLGWSDLAVDRSDHLHAVWMDYGTNGLAYAHNDGTGWTAPSSPPDPGPSDQSCRPRVTVDTAANPHVVWQERSDGYWLYYSSLRADTWTTPCKLYSRNAGGQVIRSDSAGRLHVVWGWDDGLQHIESEDTGWSSPEYITEVSAQGEIAADRRIIHALWRDSHFNLFHNSNGTSGVGETTNTGFRVATPAGRLVARFALRVAGRVVLSVYDVAGRCVLKRDLGVLSAGVHSVPLNLDSVPAGLYFGLLGAGKASQVAKFVRAK